MKYEVGDILFVKKCEYKSHPSYNPTHNYLPFHLRLRPRLHNTVGIITEVHKHSDIFRSGSKENDNVYIWLSQVDRKEYYFYEDEIECEVLK
jgi:hypothetical protein